jgi:HEAT repeat protein
MDAILPGMRMQHLSRTAAVFAALIFASIGAYSLGGDALAKGKGSDIGGPPREEVHSDRSRFGIAPDQLSDAEKAARLEVIEKEYEGLKRNQDIIPVRTRRNRVIFLGEMRYPEASKFLKKVFEGDRDMRTRVAAMVAVGKSGDFATIEATVKKALSSARKEPVFASNLPRMFEQVTDQESREWLLTRLKQKDSDVLASVVHALGHTRNPEALEHLKPLIEEHKSMDVRFEALRAYGRCGGRAAVGKLLVYLSNEDWQLRMAAAEGLGYAGEPEVIEELKRLIIRGEEPIVVETALEAVARLGTRDAVEPLIEGLRVARLRARQKTRRALVRIAKEEFRMEKDYHVDPNSWTTWWKKVKRGVDPDDPTFTESETASYFTFPIESDRVLFILDVSGSMKWPDAPKDSGIRPSDWNGRRIHVAHRELFKALRALAKQNRGRIPKLKKGETSDFPLVPNEDGEEPPTLFNLATFAGVVTPWQPDVVAATEENVEAGIAWIERQLPRGGTATYDALEFGILANNVDTIYFLSDGVPSLGRFEEQETILSEVRKRNRFKRISINTVALIVGLSPIESVRKYEDPEDMADLMARIAHENQGKFSNESKP